MKKTYKRSYGESWMRDLGSKGTQILKGDHRREKTPKRSSKGV